MGKPWANGWGIFHLSLVASSCFKDLLWFTWVLNFKILQDYCMKPLSSLNRNGLKHEVSAVSTRKQCSKAMACAWKRSAMIKYLFAATNLCVRLLIIWYYIWCYKVWLKLLKPETVLVKHATCPQIIPRCFAVASHDAGPIDTAHRWSASTPKAGAIHSETTVAIGVAFQQMSH